MLVVPFPLHRDVPKRRNTLIPSQTRPPSRLAPQKVLVNLLQTQPPRLGQEEKRQDNKHNRDPSVKVSHIRPHIPILRAQHIWRPKRRPEAKHLVHAHGVALALCAHADRVHLARGHPRDGPTGRAKGEGPDAQEDDEDLLRRRVGLGRGRGDGGKGEHRGGHDGVASEEGEAAADVFAEEWAGDGSGEDWGLA